MRSGAPVLLHLLVDSILSLAAAQLALRGRWVHQAGAAGVRLKRCSSEPRWRYWRPFHFHLLHLAPLRQVCVSSAAAGRQPRAGRAWSRPGAFCKEAPFSSFSFFSFFSNHIWHTIQFFFCLSICHCFQVGGLTISKKYLLEIIAAAHCIPNRLCEEECAGFPWRETTISYAFWFVFFVFSNEARDQTILENSSLACCVESKTQTLFLLERPHMCYWMIWAISVGLSRGRASSGHTEVVNHHALYRKIPLKRISWDESSLYYYQLLRRCCERNLRDGRQEKGMPVDKRKKKEDNLYFTLSNL